jgi:hypothetical protein
MGLVWHVHSIMLRPDDLQQILDPQSQARLGEPSIVKELILLSAPRHPELMRCRAAAGFRSLSTDEWPEVMSMFECKLAPQEPFWKLLYERFPASEPPPQSIEGCHQTAAVLERSIKVYDERQRKGGGSGDRVQDLFGGCMAVPHKEFALCSADAAITSLSVASFTARAYMDQLPESEAPGVFDFYQSTLLCGGQASHASSTERAASLAIDSSTQCDRPCPYLSLDRPIVSPLGIVDFVTGD